MVSPSIPGSTAIGSDSLPGAPQDVRIAHLVVERVESSRRARLGGPIQRPLELSSAGPCGSTGGVVSLIGIHPLLPPPGRMDKVGSLPSGALCCRRRHQYRMLPSDCLSADLHFASRRIGDHVPAAAFAAGRRRLSPVFTPALSPFRAPYAERFMGAAFPGASRRPWPSPVFARLGSSLVPLAGACPVDAAGFT